MSSFFINPLMLLGLLGLSLPLLVHLLSRRRYDVVNWGAMQFLELGRKTRRRIRLEQLLLMLLRMALIALLVFAVARPWINSGWLWGVASKQNRDVILIIDGSFSMGALDQTVTPHAAAIQRAHQFIEQLKPGDTIGLIDARDRVRPIVVPPTRDFSAVRRQLNALVAPSGSSNLAAAVGRAIGILNSTSHISREIVVLSDSQSHGWRAGENNRWARIDALRRESRIEPRLWALGTDNPQSAVRENFSVDRLHLSRELTAIGFPVRIESKIAAGGLKAAVDRRVYLEVDGQRQSDSTIQVHVEPDGQTGVEFKHRFSTPGAHIVSIVIDDDTLPGDNRADAAVRVFEAMPVLLVDGDPQPDRSKSETHFARAALSAKANKTPQVRAEVVAWDALDTDMLSKFKVVVLANVPRLDARQAEDIKRYVASGGGLLIALGDRVDAIEWNRLFHKSGGDLLPAALDTIAHIAANNTDGLHIENRSLQVPWITRFRAEHDGDFTLARFSKWWKLKLPLESAGKATGKATIQAEAKASTPPGDATERPPKSRIIARFDNRDPLLILRRYHLGTVALMTAPLDADWSTLPSKPDYVRLLHEIFLQLASQGVSRNVDAGSPLVLPVPADLPEDEYAFFGPGETEFPAVRSSSRQPTLALFDTQLTGVYHFKRKQPNDSDKHDTIDEDSFVVNFDHSESNLKTLDEEDRKRLAKNNGVRFMTSVDELTDAMFSDSSRSEFWHILLLLFLATLIAEAAMTRHLVKGGHEVNDEADREKATDSHSPAFGRNQ